MCSLLEAGFLTFSLNDLSSGVGVSVVITAKP
jgi:hypothetical protein